MPFDNPITIQIEREDVLWLKDLKEQAETASRDAIVLHGNDGQAGTAMRFTDRSRRGMRYVEVLERILKQI